MEHLDYDLSKERKGLDNAILLIMELADRLSRALKVIEENGLQEQTEYFSDCLERIVPVCGDIRNGKEALRLAEEDCKGLQRAIDKLNGFCDE